MTQNLYGNYDPLVANGILYAPINTLTFSELPVTTSYPGYNYPIPTAAQVDKFVKQAENPTPTWKKLAFYTLIAGLGIWGLKKFKLNPFKKLTNKISNKPKVKATKKCVNEKWTSLKTYCAEKYGKIKEFCSAKYQSVTNGIKKLFSKKHK